MAREENMNFKFTFAIVAIVAIVLIVGLFSMKFSHGNTDVITDKNIGGEASKLMLTNIQNDNNIAQQALNANMLNNLNLANANLRRCGVYFGDWTDIGHSTRQYTGSNEISALQVTDIASERHGHLDGKKDLVAAFRDGKIRVRYNAY